MRPGKEDGTWEVCIPYLVEVKTSIYYVPTPFVLCKHNLQKQPVRCRYYHPVFQMQTPKLKEVSWSYSTHLVSDWSLFTVLGE